MEYQRAGSGINSPTPQINKNLKKKNQREINVGIGISTGSLVAGYIGSTHTMSYSVIGDTVNTASRICSAAKGGQIIISENTFTEVQHQFQTLKLDPIKAKGKYRPVNVYSVAGIK